MKKVITIGREFGSGGREIGLRLAKKLNIPFYDKEIIAHAAEESDLSPAIIEKYDESRTYSPPVMKAGRNLFAYYQQPITDQIFLAQSKVIRKLAGQGSCVIVGRCADHVLQGQSINIFVRADIQSRIKRKCTMDIGVPVEKLERHITEVDKTRRKYYEHYTDFKWGRFSHLHLCIDTTHVDMDGCVDTIFHYINSFKK